MSSFTNVVFICSLTKAILTHTSTDVQTHTHTQTQTYTHTHSDEPTLK